MRDIVIISYNKIHFVFHDNHKNPEKHIKAKLNLDTKETFIYIP